MSQHAVYEPTAKTPSRCVELHEDAQRPPRPPARPAPPPRCCSPPGLASFTLGLLSVLAAASASISSALTLSDRVGDISGLRPPPARLLLARGACWRSAGVGRTRSLVRVAGATALLIALGLLGTFPPFFNAVAG